MLLPAPLLLLLLCCQQWLSCLAAVGPGCAIPGQRVLQCHNRSHYTYQDCDTGSLDRAKLPCADGFACEPSTGACAADELATHLLRSVDYQIVETVIASEAAHCSPHNPVADAAAGRMLCEVLHGTMVTQPTFGHSLGNTWETCPASQSGQIDGCNFTTAAGWRQCIGQNVGKQAALLTARSPHLLISAGLMEYLHKDNLDHPDDFETQCCRKGTVGQWGSNATCVPDVTTQCIQDYYTSWGKAYMDGGVRAFFFGQSRLTGGGRACNDDYTGCSRVSIAGADGFSKVLSNLKAYAQAQGYGKVYFGPQAASGFELANGTDLADWSYGAQHLYARDKWLVQPFSINGTEPALGPQWYGSGDLHDANRVNNAREIPVLLDFDNFSGDEDRPDDIRRLSAWPNATRDSFVRTLWHILRLYNPRASLSLPLSKAAGGNWPAFKQPQSQCWSGGWGQPSTWSGADGLYFGATSCAIVNVTRELFAGPAQPNVAEVLAAVELEHFGAALQSRDLTCVWAFKTLLQRDFSSVGNYRDCVEALPSLVLGARGARADLAKKVLTSKECVGRGCNTEKGGALTSLNAFLCLGDSVCVEVGRAAWEVAAGNVSQVVDRMCDAADATGLFGNAALMDPNWRIGD